MGIGPQRLNTFVMIPHVHSQDFQQGGNYAAPAGPPDATFIAANLPAAGQYGILTRPSGAFPEWFLFKDSGGAAGALLSVSSGGGVGNVLQLLNDTYGIRGSGVQATNAKFDVIQAATANGLLDIVKNGTGGIRIGTTNNPSNTADLIIGRGNDSMELGGGIFTFQLSGGSLTADMVDKSFRLQNTATFIIYNATAAAGDIRFFAGPTRVIFGKQGDDVTVDSVPVCFDIPITNAATINAGETVKWDPAVPGRCITGGATALQPIGICVLGGVGNAPGGIKATIFYMGYKAILVSEAAIVQFRRIAPGATAGRWKDNGVAGIPALQHSIGVALDAPGGSGTNFKAWIDGCRLYV